MPRIPSAADISPVGAGGSRLPSVRAEARDFGLAIAEGLADLGEGLAAARPLAEEILRKEEQQQQAEQNADVDVHRAEVRQVANRMEDDWEFDGSSPREAARNASKQLAAVEAERLRGMSSVRQAAARQATAGVHVAHSVRIAQRVQNANVDALIRKMDATLQQLQDQAVREPPAADLRAAEGTALLQSLRDAGALTPEQFAEREAAFRRSLLAAVIQAQPAVDAVADLEAGVYDAALNDPSLKDFLLTQARWRLQSEQAQGEAAVNAQVEAARRGADETVLSARTQRLLEAGAMADAELAAERARRVRETLERLRYAPEAVVRQETDQMAPPADAADAEERLKLQEETRIQAEAMLRERRHDSAAYVMSQPAVAEAFAAAERDPGLLGDAVTARMAAQAAMGLSVDERRALTRSESAAILAGLDALTPVERVAALGDLAQRYGEASGPVATTLAEAGLSPMEALLIDPASDPAAWRALTRLLERQHQGMPSKAPEGEFIAEAAEALLSAGQAAASRTGTAGVAAGTDSRLPPRKPKQSSLLEEYDEREAGYQSLLAQDYDELIDGLHPAEVSALEHHVSLATRAAGASAGDEDLARRLVVRNLRAGFPFSEAVEQALYEAGIDTANGPPSRPVNRPMTESEREVRELLSLMTPAYPSSVQDADRALAWIKEVMAIRQGGPAESKAASKALIEKMSNALEMSSDRFLFPILRNAAWRAADRPETTPWALTDAELVSVYLATGGSSRLLSEAAETLTLSNHPVAGLTAAAAALSAYQQSRMHQAYASELRRRGHLKLPDE